MFEPLSSEQPSALLRRDHYQNRPSRSRVEVRRPDIRRALFWMLGAAAFAAALSVSLSSLVRGQTAQDENFAAWPVIDGPFPSTGGGGFTIEGYDPVVVDGRCETDFIARGPDGTAYANRVVFVATAAQGGILCVNGAWRAKDGSSSGTTPLRVFLKDGVKRRSPS